MASAWIFLQYANCFASGFLTSYLLCLRSSKNFVEKEANIPSDIDRAEIVVITEEIATERTDVKNNHIYEEIPNGTQQGEGKRTETRRSEERLATERYAEQVKEEP